VCVAVRCSVLQCVAVCWYGYMQRGLAVCVAVRCSVLQCINMGSTQSCVSSHSTLRSWIELLMLMMSSSWYVGDSFSSCSRNDVLSLGCVEDSLSSWNWLTYWVRDVWMTHWNAGAVVSACNWVCAIEFVMRRWHIEFVQLRRHIEFVRVAWPVFVKFRCVHDLLSSWNWDDVLSSWRLNDSMSHLHSFALDSWRVVNEWYHECSANKCNAWHGIMRMSRTQYVISNSRTQWAMCTSRSWRQHQQLNAACVLNEWSVWHTLAHNTH